MTGADGRTDLNNYRLLPIFLVSLVLLIAATEIGRSFGKRGIAAIASALAGYASGLGRRPSQFPVYVMIVLVCALILLIQDLNRPLHGFI